MTKILVVSAHPDDEAIGCGGTIKLHTQAGDEVECIFLTSGELGCPGMEIEDVILHREHEAFESAKVLGSRVFALWKEPDSDLKCSDELISKMLYLLNERKPDTVYVTSDVDSHNDHANAAWIVKYALERMASPPEAWMYEVWSPLPVYDKVVDISETIGFKMLAIRRHETQVHRIRFDEAALCLARFRGELHNRPHGPYAEVFKKL